MTKVKLGICFAIGMPAAACGVAALILLAPPALVLILLLVALGVMGFFIGSSA